MTFNNAPWAIDGARSSSALARLATYATGGGRSGVVKPSDLRVLPLSPNGNGLRITSGGAMILNHYLSNPNEAYVVSNPAMHTVLAASMPAPIPSVGYYLVCVVVGDPEFDQTGHPFMPTAIAPELAVNYEYVRIVIVPCPAGATSFEQLGLTYPGFALARLEIPPNTTTITAAMITDLRKVSQPRQERHLLVAAADGGPLISAAYTTWPTFAPFIDVPPWATHVVAIATLSSIVSFGTANVLGNLRAKVGPVVGTDLGYDIDSPSGATRETFILSVSGDISAQAGGQVQLIAEGLNWNSVNGHLHTWGGAQIAWDVQFTESPI